MLERMQGKGNTPALLVGVQTCTAALEISMAISQKRRKQPTSRLSNTTFGYISKGCSIIPQGHCSTMFIAALFVIASTQKQPKYLLTKEYIRKMWYIYTMEYYTVGKNNNILKFSGKWMDLENIILGEVTQTQKDKYHMYSLISNF